MAAVSKRQQARNERELNELLRLPDNAVCADCGARNPGWASWSLGVFLCMRCASIHRKLGTHISKVKSLTMDTWNSDQVENMKRTGNAAANKTYNPKNKRPDIPLDVDQVDSAMERFIRKKYQEKSLADGKPEPPRRSSVSRVVVPSRSPEGSPPPPVPSKKGRFFGFGLRASSATYPDSKHDKKKKLPPEPRVDSAWTIDSDSLGRDSRMDDAYARMSDAELQRKLKQLADMGFTETVRNTSVLRRLNGDVERTVEALVRLGPRTGQSSSSNHAASTTPGISFITRSAAVPAPPSESSAIPTTTTTTNLFDEPSAAAQAVGVSVAPSHKAQGTGVSFGSNNPFDHSSQNQPASDFSQALEGMHISPSAGRPLFPHSTGGYPMQQPQVPNPRFQTMTPPVPSFSHQQYVSSPVGIETNPFFQHAPQQPPPLPQAQALPTSNNPFFTQLQQPLAQQTMDTTSTNPFVNTIPQTSQLEQQQQQQQLGLGPNFNFAPQPTSQPPVQTSQNQLQSGYRSLSQPSVISSTNPFEQQTDTVYSQSFLQHQHQHQQQVAQFQTSSPLAQPAANLQQFAQPSALVPQQTGRYDKQSILALYNQPQLAPLRPQGLQTIPEPASVKQPSPNGFQPRRSTTMPISMNHMHSAGGRNLLLQSNIASAPQPQQGSQGSSMSGIGSRHVSQESVSINNLESGRHSPDAFANLSARYVS